jgi:carbon-monoxide dehydrogenase medium subunit
MQPSELLTDISLPPVHATEGSAFLKLGRVGADIAKVSVATRLIRQGDTVVDGRIALGSVAPMPLRVRGAESHLAGQPFSNGLAEAASQLAAQEISPITDVRSTAQYRTAAARVLVRDALLAAWDRSRGDNA